MALPKPVSRADMYLSYLNYTKGLTLANLPKPVSRADMYLYNLCINRGIGGGSGGSNVTLNGEPQTNFNFIENKVVQDGLIDVTKNIDTTYKVMNGSATGDFLISTKIKPLNSLNNGYIFRIGDSNRNSTSLRFETGSYKIKALVTINGVHTVIESKLSAELNKEYDIVYSRVGDTYTLIVNGHVSSKIVNGLNCNGVLYIGAGFTTVIQDAFISYLMYYNRPLTQQEIQHNLLVLNNSPSIKELHTTDSTGKTSILKLASDTDHVEDRAGRTQEQINRTFYKRMCKEMPSQNGEPITVKNGEEGYVLSAEIKGNTQLFKRAKGSQDEWIVIPNDEGRDTVAFEYKLDSTQAIISNNGEKYPIYATEEDKANKKVILLGGVGDVQDTLEIKDDGSVVYTQNLKPVTFDGTENWSLIETRVNTLRFNFPSPQYGVALNTLGILDKIPFGNPRSGDIEGFSCLNNTFTIAIAKTKLVSEDVDGFKKWLSENNQSGLYPISTSIVTPIPKELVPTILTHNQTNILEVGGAVKPSSFKVILPVDRLAEIEARLQALENTTVDVVLNK